MRTLKSTPTTPLTREDEVVATVARYLTWQKSAWRRYMQGLPYDEEREEEEQQRIQNTKGHYVIVLTFRDGTQKRYHTESTYNWTRAQALAALHSTHNHTKRTPTEATIELWKGQEPYATLSTDHSYSSSN